MDEKNNRNEIVKAMMDLEYYPSFPKDEIDLGKYTKFPLAEISALGTAFASLPISFREITQNIGIGAREGYFKAIFPEGVCGELVKAKGGVGYRGVIKDASGKFAGQPIFIPETGSLSNVTTTIPYNPAMLFMAAALMSIDKKLDSIQETQQEIIGFLLQKEKSKLRGNLNVLADVLNNFKFNWHNEKYKTNKHILVQDIKRDAEQSIILHQEQIDKKIHKQSFIHSDQDVKNKLKKIQSEFQEYQLALYLYAFSSFLEVMLLENFESAYLESVVHKIEDYSYQYRELYTKCYDQIEGYLKSSIHSHLLSGLASINRFAGDAVAKVPVVSKSQIDETLIETSKRLGKYSVKKTEQTMEQFVNYQSGYIRPFVENINTVNRLYNQPMELLFDQENMYFNLSEG